MTMDVRAHLGTRRGDHWHLPTYILPTYLGTY